MDEVKEGSKYITLHGRANDVTREMNIEYGNGYRVVSSSHSYSNTNFSLVLVVVMERK